VCIELYRVGYLKGKSALMMFDKHANLKYKFGNRHFLAEGYYVSTVGLNEATIAKYIREQDQHDIMQDTLSVRLFLTISDCDTLYHT
jgi:putative transposase